MEYTFSYMDYEIPAAMGVELARPETEVAPIIDDSTYRVLSMKLATTVQEKIKVIFILLQNYDFASVEVLSESHKS